MKARSSIPPWKRPGWVLWFVLAAVCSCWFILHMPVDSRRMRDAPTTATQTADASPARGALGGVLPTQASGQPSDAERIFMKLETFGRLFAIVGIAAFCGGLMEARQWHMVLAAADGAPDPAWRASRKSWPCHAYSALFQRRCQQHSGKQPC